jgi:hypothetical protein
MQVLICRAFGCAFAGHQLEMEIIIPSRVKKTEAEPGNGHRLLQSKIEFVGVPVNRCVKVRHADGCVVDLQGSEVSRRREVWRECSLFSLSVASVIAELQRLRFEPGTHSLDHFCLAFEWQPVARRQVCDGQVLARAAHAFAGSIVGDIAEAIEFAVDK